MGRGPGRALRPAAVAVRTPAHRIAADDRPARDPARLVASDLAHRQLDCRLAVLSACRTGASHVAPGDEALGLPRAFLHAGARAVMVSLWTAHDGATARLMRAFYSRLSQGDSRAAAL